MIERKYLVHYLKVPSTITNTTGVEFDDFVWVRIGQHLEAFAEELNPQVDVRKNIWGFNNAIHNGYQPSSAVDTFYATKDAEDNDYYLYQYLEAIALNRWQGDQCKTERIDALVSIDVASSTAVVNPEWAWKEECYCVPNSLGGDTSGYQIPFNITNLGNREDVTSKVSFSKNGLTVRA